MGRFIDSQSQVDLLTEDENLFSQIWMSRRTGNL